MKSIQTMALITVGVATWVAAMASGQFIVLLTNVPASSAIVTGFLVPFLLVLGARAVPTNWSVTVAFTTYGILSIPFVLLGPPGVHKIVVALIAGVAADVIIRLLQKRMEHGKFVIAFSAWALLLAALAWVFFSILDLPGRDKFMQAFPVLTAVFVITAIIGSLTASTTFKRMKLADRPLIKRLQKGD